MWQRHLFVCASCLLLFACASENRIGEDVQVAALYKADADTKALKALEPSLVPHSRATRAADLLTLPIEKGPAVRFENKPACKDASEAHCVFYSLVADLPDRHAYIVAVSYYEGGNYLWIDDRTGRNTSIPAPPHFGPDPDLMLTLDNDTEFGDHGIAIWKRSDDAMAMIFSHKTNADCSMTLQGWDASGIHIELDAYMEHPQRRWKSDVVLADGKWRYSENLVLGDAKR